jgi:hypothetical protein
MLFFFRPFGLREVFELVLKASSKLVYAQFIVCHRSSKLGVTSFGSELAGFVIGCEV